MKKYERILIVDDDPMNNMLCKHIIRKVTDPETLVKDFILPAEALQYISNPTDPHPTTLVLLDINMPEINGWEFLEQFESNPENSKKRFTIFILSSSVDHRDKEKAAGNSRITGYLEKPLTESKLREAMLV